MQFKKNDKKQCNTATLFIPTRNNNNSICDFRWGFPTVHYTLQYTFVLSLAVLLYIEWYKEDCKEMLDHGHIDPYTFRIENGEENEFLTNTHGNLECLVWSRLSVLESELILKLQS